MSQSIQAIYEHGVFRPLEPVNLAENKQVSLVVSEFANSGGSGEKPQVVTDEATMKRQREALARLRAKMESLPDYAPNDGLGGADHDFILYGWQK